MEMVWGENSGFFVIFCSFLMVQFLAKHSPKEAKSIQPYLRQIFHRARLEKRDQTWKAEEGSLAVFPLVGHREL